MPNAIAAARGVFITDELARRPVRRRDHRREKEAFRWLLAELAEAPEKILPDFVSTAMDLLRGSSAGISLFEADPEPGVFRWQHLHGVLAQFENSTTPRHHSPCGVTLDRNAPVLAAHPERVYEWIADAGIIVPEVLLVPLYIGTNQPFGTLWVVGDHAGHFCQGDVCLARELADFISAALRIIGTEDHLVEALHQQELLAREMGHRVKNVFALTQSLIRLSAKSAKSPDELAEALSGRLAAVAAAHELVRHDEATVSTSIRDLVTAVVRPYEEMDGSKIEISGPRVFCGRAAANGLVLVLHELATNAVKYGALATRAGHLAVTWEVIGEALVIDWHENGSPTFVVEPSSTGFGTKLIERTITGQFTGTFERKWLPGGASCTLTLPLRKLIN
jgi:two-component sensor histidine kinase